MHVYCKVAGICFEGRPDVVGDLVDNYNLIGSPVTLEREPTNQYDPNAVKVILKDKHIGYIPKDSTGLLDKLISAEVSQIGFSEGNLPYCELKLKVKSGNPLDDILEI